MVLQRSINPIPSEVQVVIAYFAPGLSNSVSVQLWGKQEGINYTLDWEVTLQSESRTGRTLVSIQLSSLIYSLLCQ